MIRLLPFLALLFVSTLCNAAVVPFMPFFMVEGLAQPPWTLSLYSSLAVSLTVGLNRAFARRIDSGARIAPLLLVAILGYALASLSLALSPTVPVVLTLGVLGYGLSATSISGMFATGGHLAERHGIDRTTFNAWMRAVTSSAWMIGPALSFSVAGTFGPGVVFKLALGTVALWAVTWYFALPRTLTAPAPPKPSIEQAATNIALWFAVAFVFCLSISHGLTFSALPLFLVQEAGLPDFTPGVAFSVKTFVEILAIFASPFLIARFGLRLPLLGCALLAVGAIQILASVDSVPRMVIGAALEGLYYGLFAALGISYIQSFAQKRPAQATAMYWNTLMVSGLLAAPAVGLIAQVMNFHMVILISSGAATLSVLVLLAGIVQSIWRLP